MLKFNLYSKPLNAMDIEGMFKSGLCSKMEEKFDPIRLLKWEDILLKERHGTVKDRTVTMNECVFSTLE